ncbi:MAG: hypothetical protein HQM13_05010 [SAR324 cluster bacterium]|nr:hypothetical protein [SAR324 cluster bacterium]
MSLKRYLISGITIGLLFVLLLSMNIQAITYVPFSGRRTAWYYNQKDGRAVIALKGPFLDQFSCEQKAHAEKIEECYQRETVEFFQWRQNQQKMWVLPLRTGEQSQHLVFANRKECHQVAESGFYLSSAQLKIPLRPDLKTCIVSTVYFDEIEKRYSWVDQHPKTGKPFPQRYQAWSILLETGHYRRLMQFKQKAHCEKVALEGKYYGFLPRSGFGEMRVIYTIPAELRKCVRRASLTNEIPIIYQYIHEHQTTSASSSVKKLSGKIQKVWVLTIQKPGGAYSLFFERKQACFRIQQQRFYFREINRGKFFPSTPIKTSFEALYQECTEMELPSDAKERLYPFVEKH